MEKPNYYAIIPANVRYNENINANEKLLYAEITALCNAKGYCWASNNYFAELYKCTPQAISKWINNLKNNNFLKIEYIYKNGSKEIQQRNICINNGLLGINNGLGGYQQTIKDNITSNNNIYIEKTILTDTDTEKQLQSFNQVLENNSETKKEYDNIPKPLQIDTEYYNKFLEKWNAYGEKYKNRQVKLSSLQQLDKQNLKNINLPIVEISKGLMALFNQKDIIESCLVTPKHFLNDFQKYYQAGLEFEKTNVMIQFYQSKNNL